MQYLCEKQLSIGGVTYNAGDVISDGVILPERTGKLMRSGYIAEIGGESPEKQIENTEKSKQFNIPLFKDHRIIMASLDEEAVKTWSFVLQKNASEAVEIIDTINNDELLKVIHATDSRKSIKAAAESRAAIINVESGESPLEDDSDR